MAVGSEFAYEVAFELKPIAPVGDDLRIRASSALGGLEALDGVLAAHVDVHGTWALVTYNPGLLPIAPIVGCLSVHGLSALRIHTLPRGNDPGEDVG